MIFLEQVNKRVGLNPVFQQNSEQKGMVLQADCYERTYFGRRGTKNTKGAVVLRGFKISTLMFSYKKISLKIVHSSTN